MIVDASVAMKWLVVENDSEAANELIRTGDLVAPDLVFAEVANGLWKKWRRGELLRLPTSLATLATVFDAVEPAAALLPRAAALAIELAHPAYDCFYLALAEARDDVVVTADHRFVRACAGSPYSRYIRSFGDPV